MCGSLFDAPPPELDARDGGAEILHIVQGPGVELLARYGGNRDRNRKDRLIAETGRDHDLAIVRLGRRGCGILGHQLRRQQQGAGEQNVADVAARI